MLPSNNSSMTLKPFNHLSITDLQVASMTFSYIRLQWLASHAIQTLEILRCKSIQHTKHKCWKEDRIKNKRDVIMIQKKKITVFWIAMHVTLLSALFISVIGKQCVMYYIMFDYYIMFSLLSRMYNVLVSHAQLSSFPLLVCGV